MTKQSTGNWNFKNFQKIISLFSILALIIILSSTNIIGIVSATTDLIFEDGFESNSFNVWDQTYDNSGGSLRTVSNVKYSGNYAAEFTTNNYNGYEQVRITKEIYSNSELYARAYINVDTNGINDSEDKLYFIRFSAGGDNVLFAGWRQSGSNIKWHLLIRDGSGYKSGYSQSIANTNQWYCMEVYWQKDTNNGKAAIWINGNQEITIDGQNTNNYGDVTKVHFGVAEAYRINYSKVYGDSFVISDEYIGPIEQTDELQQETDEPNSNYSDEDNYSLEETSTETTLPETTLTYSTLLDDDFESRNLNQWTGTETTYRETVGISSYNPQDGNYHVRFSSSGSRYKTENAYLYQTTNLDVAYVTGYFNTVWGLPLDDQNDEFYLITLLADGENVAGIGITRDNGEMKWCTYGRDGATWVRPTYSEDPTIERNQWYKIELYWQGDANQGKLNVFIDGEQIFQINNINTDYFGNVNSIRMGVINTYSVNHRMIVYGDSFEIKAGTLVNNIEEISAEQPSQNPPSESTTPEADITTSSVTYFSNGLSGYPTSTAQIDAIIQVMDENNLNIFRMSFNPEWFGGKPHPYRENYVQYFLDHCDYTIIIDRNHIYPPTEDGAQEARNNWNTVENSIFEVLEMWPNNNRVAVELINEYVLDDFYSRMQDLVDSIRDAGYTNPIVVNKWNQPWTVINDPVDNTYQGYHFYFNSWSVSGAISQMNTALSRGIKIINTEIGANYNEYNSFTTATVEETNEFLAWCAEHGIGNTVWMNENLNNWERYQQLGLTFP